MLLKDRKILITGAGTGIGKEIAIIFAKEGGECFLTGRNEKNLVEVRQEIIKNGGISHYKKTDLLNDDQLIELVKSAIQEMGRIDILINNAGISKEIPFSEMSMVIWDEIMRTNFRAIVNLTREVLPNMLSHKYGNIVNIGSGAAIRGLPGSCAYSASKAAVVCFTQALGDEIKGNGVRINAICPGPVDTELFQKSAKKDYILNAGGDLFSTETVANGVLYLATDQSRGMNSQVLIMRGFNRW